ncbi:MAG: hypothetical protein NTX25_12150 [Proteobacteria bacterium]|nr:hypothetical protein [Pseudomonadota bacterium]
MRAVILIRTSIIASILISCGQKNNFSSRVQSTALTASNQELPSVHSDQAEPAANPSPAETPASPELPEVTPQSREEHHVASEPVPIGGAYLSCLYKGPMVQYGADWLITCSLDGLAGIDLQSVQANFEKFEAAASPSPLEIASFDATNLVWTLKEKPDSLRLMSVRGFFKAANLENFELSTEVQPLATLSLKLKYWIAGEPNNNGGIENCTEFVSASRMSRFDPTTRANSGPLARYNDVPCNLSNRFLCRKMTAPTGANWLLSTVQAPYAKGATACPTGYKFNMPYTEAEHREVMALLDAVTGLDSVWVPLDDLIKEGDFQLHLR